MFAGYTVYFTVPLDLLAFCDFAVVLSGVAAFSLVLALARMLRSGAAAIFEAFFVGFAAGFFFSLIGCK